MPASSDTRSMRAGKMSLRAAPEVNQAVDLGPREPAYATASKLWKRPRHAQRTFDYSERGMIRADEKLSIPRFASAILHQSALKALNSKDGVSPRGRFKNHYFRVLLTATGGSDDTAARRPRPPKAAFA